MSVAGTSRGPQGSVPPGRAPTASDDGRFSLAGQVAVVTGANSGLGRTIALGLLDAGAYIVGTGRDESKNASFGQELGVRGEVVAADVRDEEAMASVIGEATRTHGRVDILVNNAGFGGRSGFLDMSQDEWRQMLDTHLTGAFLATRSAARAMIAGGRGGSVINIGSMYSLFGAPAGAHYTTAKTGLIGLTRALAVELAPHDIRVNAILPGWIETEMTRMVRESALAAGVLPKIPLARFGVPDDLVGVAIMLASPAGRYITGAEIAIDGGYHVADRPR